MLFGIEQKVSWTSLLTDLAQFFFQGNDILYLVYKPLVDLRQVMNFINTHALLQGIWYSKDAKICRFGKFFLDIVGLEIVVGNQAIGDYASVSGGRDNSAIGVDSSVSGGNGNTAGGLGSSVSGGLANTANTFYASVSGGRDNIASEYIRIYCNRWHWLSTSQSELDQSV